MTAPHDHEYRLVTAAVDVDDEILDLAREVTDDYTDDPIDWDDVWDRIDGERLTAGDLLDLGPTTNSPAMQKIRRVIRQERRGG